MDKEKYLAELRSSESELRKLEGEFAKLNINNQEYHWIESLLDHLGDLIEMVNNGYCKEIKCELAQSYLDYFQKNSEGLNLVLEAKKRYKNGNP
jgi:hypothetical protein